MFYHGLFNICGTSYPANNNPTPNGRAPYVIVGTCISIQVNCNTHLDYRLRCESLGVGMDVFRSRCIRSQCISG